jgi:alpha-ribazole phosphatase/probable phosphoglycerate mutase
MSDRVRVWCLRHAESENVTAGMAGAVPTAPLTERGRDQAIDAAQALAHEPITRVYCSTALRARQTAGLLAALPTIEVAAVPELVEVGIGKHEGTIDPAIRTRTADVLRAWVVGQDLGQRVADGETGHEVLARVTAAFQKIAGAHPGETIAVVGHVAGLTLALGRLCALGPQVWGTPLPHAQPFLIEWDGQAWHCPAWPGTGAA